MQQYRSLANLYGLKVVCYEGGQGLTGDPPNFNVGMAAQLDPRMATLYAALGAALEANGVDSMCFTCDVGTWAPLNGYWGQITDVTQWNANVSPRYMTSRALALAGAQSPARAPTKAQITAAAMAYAKAREAAKVAAAQKLAREKSLQKANKGKSHHH